MTEYEISSLAASIMANFLATFTIFLTIVTAYVITAFVAGSRLTLFQLSIVNACFLTSALVIGFLSVTIYQRATSLAKQTWDLTDTTAPPIDVSGLIFLLYLGLLVGGLLFMRSVRRSPNTAASA
jgi:uncharacterized membrane protein